MNSVVLVGNLTKDPEIRETPNGIKTCSFSIACRRRFKNASGEYESDFINCVAWRQTAEFVANNFSKGEKIGLTGSIQSRTYDAQDGSKRHVIEVLCDSVEFVQPKAPNGLQGAYSASQSYTVQASKQRNTFMPVDDDDLPF